jgi:tetratricopeptide (TPR) repeat protein
MLSSLTGVEADQAEALDELGMALCNTHHEGESEEVLRRAINIDQRRGADGQIAAAVPMQNLAVLLGNEGRYQDALPLVSQAVELQRRYLSPDDPDALTPLATYAMILTNLHRPAEAEPILRDVAMRSARINGPTHTTTLVAQTQLGETLTDLHRYAEAEAILRPAAEALERNEGLTHRYTLSAWADFTIAACESDDAPAGLEAARRITEIRKQTLPEGDWRLFAAQTNIGLCLVRLKRYAEAEPILTAARARLESARGPDNYWTRLNYQATQQLYAATARAEEAAQMASKMTP